jgi:predicted PurR-regulated permease PerM
MADKQTIEISYATILKFLAIILGLVFIYLIKNILVMLFLAVIIAAAVDMPIDWLVRHKFRRGLAVGIVYFLAIAIFALIVYLIVPPLAGQLKIIAGSLPDYILELQIKLQGLGAGFDTQSLQQVLLNLGNKLGSSLDTIFLAIIDFFGGVFSAFVILIISIYLAAREQGVKKFILSFVPSARQPYATSLVDRILFKLGAWLRGQIILMAAVGVLVFVGLSILKIKFALTLALIAALLEIVPIIGPIIAAVPAILFAFLQSPGLAILVAAMYYVVQELEKYLIVPQVMKRAVGLNPISIMVAILIGAELYGIMGAVLAIPVAAMVSIGFNDFMEWKKSGD